MPSPASRVARANASRLPELPKNLQTGLAYDTNLTFKFATSNPRISP
jgi:hypothetical protein